jgi:hypothetical protein
MHVIWEGHGVALRNLILANIKKDVKRLQEAKAPKDTEQAVRPPVLSDLEAYSRVLQQQLKHDEARENAAFSLDPELLSDEEFLDERGHARAYRNPISTPTQETCTAVEVGLGNNVGSQTQDEDESATLGGSTIHETLIPADTQGTDYSTQEL